MITIMKKLDIVATLKEGIALGIANYLSVLFTVVLYILTIWIPYLNVGTTIALSLLPAEMAKGKVVNPLYIFDGKYRRNMGEYFILMGLLYLGVIVGFLFLIVPGCVIALAWTFAVILFVDKDMNALEALRESNRLTYGNKGRIFVISLLLSICIELVSVIIGGIFGIGNVEWLEVIGSILVILISLSIMPLSFGLNAVMYKKLVLEEASDEKTEEVVEVEEQKVEEVVE
jgi:uncharacterized membrane protein